jgi:uncharacterized protein YdhG (YjbR/CyaY superfamily)
MARTAFKSIDDYFAAQPAPLQRVLKKVRAAIRKAVPEADEGIAYGIPTFRLPGGVVLHFAGWRQHCSVYPANSRVVAAFGDELTSYLVEKSTLRFPLDRPLPVQLIARIAAFRAGEISSRRKTTDDTRTAPSPTRRRRP